MSKERYEYKLVRRLEPDAIGEPGQRRFRLLIEGQPGAACLWLEKEQLQALGIAVDQVLAPMALLWSREPQPTPTVTAPVGFPAQPTIEFQVGKLALGYDEESEQFSLFVHDVEDDQEGPATLSLRASRGQMRSLSQAIQALVTAGRQRCPLCGQPMEERHHCPGTNGHGLKQS